MEARFEGAIETADVSKSVTEGNFAHREIAFLRVFQISATMFEPAHPDPASRRHTFAHEQFVDVSHADGMRDGDRFKGQTFVIEMILDVSLYAPQRGLARAREGRGTGVNAGEAHAEQIEQRIGDAIGIGGGYLGRFAQG